MRPVPPGPAPASGGLPRRPRAILFDVYGTLLVRSGRRSRGVLSVPGMTTSVITRHGLASTAPEIASALKQAIAEEHAAQRTRGVRHPEVRIECIWERLFPRREEEEYRLLAAAWETAERPVLPARGCRRLLGRLRRMELALGIVSNAQSYTPLVFAAMLGGRPEDIGFSRELCIYSFEHGIAKPAGDLFQLAAERLAGMGIAKEQAVMVGNDPVADIAPAARCGFMTVHVLGGSGGGVESGADATIGRLADLDALLGGCRR